MPQYIYRLHSHNLTFYVGRTNDPKRRELEHRFKLDFGGTGSKEIPEEYDWKLEVLEKCTADDMKLRERYWYDELKPLYNKRNPKLYQWEIEERQRAYQERLEMFKNDQRIPCEFAKSEIGLE